MGYWIVGQVRIMMSSVMYKSKLKMEKILGGPSWCHVSCSWGPTWVVTGALLYLTVLGVELVDLRMHFDIFGSLHAPVLGLIVSLGSGV